MYISPLSTGAETAKMLEMIENGLPQHLKYPE
jgi:hypothetical protein